MSYAAAHRALVGILAGPQFHQPPPPKPWWMRVLQWLADHLHLTLTQTQGRTILWVLAGVALCLLVALVTYGVVRMRRRALTAKRTQATAASEVPAWQLAQRQLEAGDYAGMIETWLECLAALARQEGWLDEVRTITVRRCVRALRSAGAAPPFVDTFATLAQAHEAVRYAGRPLTAAQAQALHSQALAVLAPGKEAV